MKLLNVFKKKTSFVKNLINAKDSETVLEKLTVLQNEISVYYNTKIIAVTSVEGDALPAAFAKALADAYNHNGEKTLIIDANLYGPKLAEILNLQEGLDDIAIKDASLNGSVKLSVLDKNASVITMNKQIYPSDVFKNKVIHQLVNDNKDQYDHVILLAPSVKKHKDITLLGDIVESIILVTERSYTKKKDIFDAIQFFNASKLPLAKTIIIK